MGLEVRLRQSPGRVRLAEAPARGAVLSRRLGTGMDLDLRQRSPAGVEKQDAQGLVRAHDELLRARDVRPQPDAAPQLASTRDDLRSRLADRDLALALRIAAGRDADLL